LRCQATLGGVWWIIWRLLLKDTGIKLRVHPGSLYDNWRYRSLASCFGENRSTQILMLG
jgi:hypothetical protein